jgi:circadian clock protein KaiC
MAQQQTHGALADRAATGIAGLDAVLRGGFRRNRVFLIEGVPGSGKTTLAMQFLLDGVAQGEKVLYVTLSETTEELREVASSHGWSLEGVTVRDISPSADSLQAGQEYTMFHPSEVELGETTKAILADVEQTQPTRVVFDSLSELRLLAGNPLRYRRQILALKQFFAGRQCTVLLLDDLTSAPHDLQVQSIAHGVVALEQLNPEYGAERRRLFVRKYRGVAFRGGLHDYVIRKGGIEVFPRLVASESRPHINGDKLSSGLPQLDQLLGGGLERGTSTLVVGAPGTGKSSLAAQFAVSEAKRGRHTSMFIFDESRNTLLTRGAGLGIDLAGHEKAGLIHIQQIDPAELSPGEFAHRIRQAVEQTKSAIVIIDSLNGYLNAMPDERFLAIQLHEMLTFLGHGGVATLLVGAHTGLIGAQMSAPVDASYLADAVILMRYYETKGEIRQAISVVKKRGGAHERTIRDFRMQEGRIDIGHPLREFRGVLTGVPVYEGPSGEHAEGPRAA